MKHENEIDPYERLARHLDYNLLRTFIAIIQHGGISQAAKHMHLTQPAVSQALKRFEEQLNCRLIDRNTRKFEITETGHRIYRKALDIQTQISRLGDIASEDKNDLSGHLRLLLSSRIKSAEFDDLIQKFHQHYPNISLRLDVLPSIEIQGLIQQGHASAGFCLLRGHPKGITSKIFLKEYFGFYCGPTHPLYGRSELSPEALKKEDFITFPSDQIGGVLSPLTIYREQHLYESRVIATSYNLDEIIRLTRLGVGIGTIPTHEAEPYLKKNKLWRLQPNDNIGPIYGHIIWNTAAEKTMAEQVFLKFVENKIHEYKETAIK